MNYDEREIVRQFLATITAGGITPRSSSFEPMLDGRLHRFPLEGDIGSEKSGGYCVYTDKRPAGWAKDFRQDISVKWSYSLSDSERREYAQQQNNPEAHANAEKERRESERRKAEERRLHEENVRRLQRLAFAEWHYADSSIERHPYLRSRFTDLGIYILDNGKYGIFRTIYANDYSRIIRFPLKYCTATLPGGKCERGQLLVPMVDVLTDSFRTLIRVMAKPTPEGKFMKPYYPVISPTGSAFILAPNPIEQADCLYVAEGFCTGLAVFVLTCERSYKGSNSPVFSAGGSNNLLPVCTALRKRYPDKKIIVMADDDRATKAKTGHNPGIEAAENCVSAGVADYFKAPPVHDVRNFDWYDFLKELYTNRKKGY